MSNDVIDIAAGDDPVRQRLVFGAGIDIRHVHMIRVAFTPGAQRGNIRLGNQRAGRTGVGQDDLRLRVENLAVSAMKRTPANLVMSAWASRAYSEKLQAVAHLVSHALDFRCSVVMGEGYNTGDIGLWLLPH